MIEYYLIIIVVILIFSFICSCSPKNHKKKNRTNDDENDYSSLIVPKYKKKFQTYLKYCNELDDNELYLTWRYQGTDLLNNHIYGLVLLPYKNKQNEFVLHMNDAKYLRQFYQKYEITILDEKINGITFLTSEYNPNKENYLELEAIDENIYIVRSSLWTHKKPFYYLHIDEKNKLYFETGINDNIAKFALT